LQLAKARQEDRHTGTEHRVPLHPPVVGMGDLRTAQLQRLQCIAGDSVASSARISPLSPSRTSSRLAGRSDSSGTQPWAIASSTDTDTESLRGRLMYQRARA
jgi:hypothetical protein